VRDFVDAAAREIGIALDWRGKGLRETATVRRVDSASGARVRKGQTIVRVDPRYFRPTEVATLLGDARKARRRLGWKPKVTFKQLVAEMVREDLKAAERDALVKRHGYNAYDYHE
jgi:GDPmannose 4,6-dehydratase